MKANRWTGILLLLLLVATVFQLLAQQTEADRKLIDEIRAKAEKGDPLAQINLGFFYERDNGVSKDEVEACRVAGATGHDHHQAVSRSAFQ